MMNASHLLLFDPLDTSYRGESADTVGALEGSLKFGAALASPFSAPLSYFVVTLPSGGTGLEKRIDLTHPERLQLAASLSTGIDVHLPPPRCVVHSVRRWVRRTLDKVAATTFPLPLSGVGVLWSALLAGTLSFPIEVSTGAVAAGTRGRRAAAAAAAARQASAFPIRWFRCASAALSSALQRFPLVAAVRPVLLLLPQRYRRVVLCSVLPLSVVVVSTILHRFVVRQLLKYEGPPSGDAGFTWGSTKHEQQQTTRRHHYQTKADEAADAGDGGSKVTPSPQPQSSGRPYSVLQRLMSLVVHPAIPRMEVYEGCLPRQPVPSLSATVDDFIDTTAAVAVGANETSSANQHLPGATSATTNGERELVMLRRLADRFKREEGLVLQRVLKAAHSHSGNELAQWMPLQCRLASRVPLPRASSYVVMQDHLRHPHHPAMKFDPVDRAAVLLFLFAQLEQQITNRTLPPVCIDGSYPVCGQQLSQIFYTCRLPGREADVIHHYRSVDRNTRGGGHAVVTYRGCIYRVELQERKKGRLLPPADLAKALRHIVASVESSMAHKDDHTEQQQQQEQQCHTTEAPLDLFAKATAKLNVEEIPSDRSREASAGSATGVPRLVPPLSLSSHHHQEAAERDDDWMCVPDSPLASFILLNSNHTSHHLAHPLLPPPAAGAAHSISRSGGDLSIAALTAAPRMLWADARKEFLLQDPHNASSLQHVEDALCVLTLPSPAASQHERGWSRDPEPSSGRGTADTAEKKGEDHSYRAEVIRDDLLGRGSSCVWHDKSLHVMVGEDGHIAYHVDSACCEPTVFLWAAERILQRELSGEYYTAAETGTLVLKHPSMEGDDASCRHPTTVGEAADSEKPKKKKQKRKSQQAMPMPVRVRFRRRVPLMTVVDAAHLHWKRDGAPRMAACTQRLAASDGFSRTRFQQLLLTPSPSSLSSSSSAAEPGTLVVLAVLLAAKESRGGMTTQVFESVSAFGFQKGGSECIRCAGTVTARAVKAVYEAMVGKSNHQRATAGHAVTKAGKGVARERTHHDSTFFDDDEQDRQQEAAPAEGRRREHLAALIREACHTLSQRRAGARTGKLGGERYLAALLCTAARTHCPSAFLHQAMRHHAACRVECSEISPSTIAAGTSSTGVSAATMPAHHHVALSPYGGANGMVTSFQFVNEEQGAATDDPQDGGVGLHWCVTAAREDEALEEAVAFSESIKSWLEVLCSLLC